MSEAAELPDMTKYGHRVYSNDMNELVPISRTVRGNRRIDLDGWRLTIMSDGRAILEPLYDRAGQLIIMALYPGDRSLTGRSITAKVI